jgi:hypothetical protein
MTADLIGKTARFKFDINGKDIRIDMPIIKAWRPNKVTWVEGIHPFDITQKITQSRADVEIVGLDFKKYFFKYKQGSICLEVCNYPKDDKAEIMIGSGLCQLCPHNKGYNTEFNWIKCEFIGLVK